MSRTTGVRAETLRAWERRYGVVRPSRSDGGIRRYSETDVARVRLMQHHLAQGLSVHDAAAQVLGMLTTRGEEGRGVPEVEARRAVASLADALDAFDEAAADRVLDALLERFTAPVVLVDVVLPYLERVGARWETRSAAVAEEHFSSRFCEARMLAIARGWSRGSGPRAVLACVPGDQHTLGLVAFGIVLHTRGWAVVYLGADTPVHEVGRAAAATAADVVVLQAALAPHVVAATSAIRGLDGGAIVTIGGPGVRPEDAVTTGATVLPRDLVRAAAELEDLVRERGEATPLST